MLRKATTLFLVLSASLQTCLDDRGLSSQEPVEPEGLIGLKTAIHDAWNGRESTVSTIMIRIIDRRSEPRFQLDKESPAETKMVASTSLHRLYLESDRLAYAYKRILGVKPRAAISGNTTFDGIRTVRITRYPGGKTNATKSGGSPASTYKNILLRPILMAYRPLAERSRTFDLPAASVVDQGVRHQGYDCVILREPKNGPLRNEIWVSRELDYLPVRFVSKIYDHANDGTTSIDMSIAYEPTSPHNLESFTWDFYDNETGILAIRSEVSITSLEFNRYHELSEFETELSDSTQVLDLDKRKNVR